MLYFLYLILVLFLSILFRLSSSISSSSPCCHLPAIRRLNHCHNSFSLPSTTIIIIIYRGTTTVGLYYGACLPLTVCTAQYKLSLFYIICIIVLSLENEYAIQKLKKKTRRRRMQFARTTTAGRTVVSPVIAVRAR